MKMVQPTLRVRLKELQEQNARMESLVKKGRRQSVTQHSEMLAA